MTDTRHIWLGLDPTALGLFSEGLIHSHKPRICIFISEHFKDSENLAEDFLFYNNALRSQEHQATVKLLPEPVDFDPESDSRAMDALCDRLNVLTAIHEYIVAPTPLARPLVIFTTPAALLAPCPSPKSFSQKILSIQTNKSYPLKTLVQQLADFGYTSEAVCERPGEFAIRGGLLDIYPLNANEPYRIDFFGDEIESIQPFNPTSQRTLPLPSVLNSLAIAGLPSTQKNDFTTSLLDYLTIPVSWFFNEPDQFKDPQALLNFLAQSTRSHTFYAATTFDTIAFDIFKNIKNAASIKISSESLSKYQDPSLFSQQLGFERYQSEHAAHLHFVQQLLNWQTEGYDIYVVSHNEGEKQRFFEFLKEHKDLRHLKPRSLIGNLHLGCKIEFNNAYVPDLLDLPNSVSTRGIVITTDNEIFGRYKQRIPTLQRKRIPQKSQVDQLLDFSEIVEGDYLVHIQHGICRFQGLRTIDLKGKKEEVITLEFDQGIHLHVPLHESHLISRYVGLAKIEPKLGRIGSSSFEKTRRAAECASLDLAAKMLSLQAERQTLAGFAFASDTPMQKEFENAFLYRETPDQLKAILAAKADMEKPIPMDRLLCGDVGFGKTEVAIRAAFKAVMSGKQVAILVPTTVLCQQHYNTFKERMADYPIVVEMLSRFRQPKDQDKIITQLSLGKIDILIGTHRLLSEDISFKDLGLLVIDEEHRFGVKQKERIKHLRTCVDVLSMSATPIPRTLHMALAGARDLSVIETPPQSRLPIQTFIKHYTPDVIKDAIEYETKRGGQVFYLHNRIGTIDSIAQRIEELIPNIRVAIGHGQMDEETLERVMTRFVEGQYDVLVCTTIIESGLDIPNCNTILIDGADKFGLSQLYQLRGRVGRFNRQAYCYLLLHKKKYIHPDAHKRLTTLKQYNQLGSGFKIAMRDLELRGAGNLLGAEQSGHIAGVGFDLYCQLLKQSIARLKGDKSAAAIRANVRLDFVIVGEQADTPPEKPSITSKSDFQILKEDTSTPSTCPPIEAYIPKDYIQEPSLRIEFYRRLALADSLESIQKVQEDLSDRFGEIPKNTIALIKYSEIRCLAEKKSILEVTTDSNRLQCIQLQAGKKVYLKQGNHFPRLTKTNSLLRLEEIKSFLKRQTI